MLGKRWQGLAPALDRVLGLSLWSKWPHCVPHWSKPQPHKRQAPSSTSEATLITICRPEAQPVYETRRKSCPRFKDWTLSSELRLLFLPLPRRETLGSLAPAAELTNVSSYKTNPMQALQNSEAASELSREVLCDCLAMSAKAAV